MGSESSGRENRAVFQYPGKLEAKPDRGIQERGVLLWRVIMRQPEAHSGLVRIFRDPFLRAYGRMTESMSGTNVLLDTKRTADLLNMCGRHGVESVDVFAGRVAIAYQHELNYRECRKDQFSVDILFHVIELLSIDKSENQAADTIRNMQSAGKELFTSLDKETFVHHLKAYNGLTNLIRQSATLKSAVDKRDHIIQEAAAQHASVTLHALDAMFRNIIAQALLSKKYRCDTLIVEWIQEYGFDAEQMVRISRYIPYDSDFTQFRSLYARAMQSLRGESRNADLFQSDMFLLRTLANFYTSWVMKVSAQLTFA